MAMSHVYRGTIVFTDRIVVTDVKAAGQKKKGQKAEVGRRQEKLLREQAEHREKQQQERNRHTTFGEFTQHCHNLLSKSLKVGNPAQSTTGKIPPPTGKYCPLRLEHWADCAIRQREIYDSVCHYLRPLGEDAPRLFAPVIELEGLGHRFAHRPLSSEKDLESYERFAVEDHIHDIIAALCQIPGAREEFQLGNGVWFDNHANALDENPPDEVHPNEQPARPINFYKPPHKLSNENLRAGLRPLDFYQEIVEPETVPTDGPDKLKYNAARLAGSAIVQEYHVMIQEGLEYSYLTTGLGIVLLRVPDDCSTLYYYLCEPNLDVDNGVEGPRTAIERVLCLCLMSFRSACRDQAWRNAARAQLPIWETSFSHARSQIPPRELRQKPPGSDYISPECTSSHMTSSEYQPSSPFESPLAQGRRPPTRSTRCAPANTAHQENPSDSDDDPATSAKGKRRFSQIASSPPAPLFTPTTPKDPSHRHAGQSRAHNHEFCTQKCLLGLQRGDILDPKCPNVDLHRVGQKINRHLIRAAELVYLVKRQLDENMDVYCTPFGQCGSYGAPFKVTSATYGYTMVGKGTTSRLWHEVSQEAEIYRILQSIQGSAVPIYFRHGAGEIRHMLLMATMEHAISLSKQEVSSLGVVHDDLRPENILWSDELQRALIIDFHRCHLKHRPLRRHLTPSRAGHVKRMYYGTGELRTKRMRVN
ncbi:uncharacterized protein BO97DRAFT_438911 [Aspergillus homomorphus CBS 101889]|uniref:Protein kinase domain-containing protein n=1 Tax=Aspergillus homomorphus (strain CBS 101889) TaxID=1450537 RepID=A0A395HH30_ASPHC|nr:hypothetical protein BO97DRAFT_438911 [Aspergillus homomorphus CBS 101889]RAL06793.1 hypothetical protein BO97DRAFT_438911 [Aspergillus homomorphus CBS 101889]